MKKVIDYPDVTVERVKFIQKVEGHKTFTAGVISIISSYYTQKYYTKHKGGGSGGVVDPAKKEYPIEEIEAKLLEVLRIEIIVPGSSLKFWPRWKAESFVTITYRGNVKELIFWVNDCLFKVKKREIDLDGLMEGRYKKEDFLDA